jgi:hypothetical protein
MKRSKSASRYRGGYGKKDFIHGYAAHVPKMQHLFGVSTGKMVSVLNSSAGVDHFLQGGTVVDGKIRRIKVREGPPASGY